MSISALIDSLLWDTKFRSSTLSWQAMQIFQISISRISVYNSVTLRWSILPFQSWALVSPQIEQVNWNCPWVNNKNAINKMRKPIQKSFLMWLFHARNLLIEGGRVQLSIQTHFVLNIFNEIVPNANATVHFVAFAISPSHFLWSEMNSDFSFGV